jgi:ankyrin repeat protein
VTPLVLAKKCPKTGSAEYLESVGASDEVGDAWMKELTPFSLAAAKGDSTTVKKMISAGYPVNKTDKFHNTALHYAARSGNIEMMQLLLKHGAKINFQGEEYYTPLLYAAWRGPISSCRYLIKKGCDLRAQGLGDVSALNLATERNSVELVKFFLKHGIKVNNGRGGWTGTPLHSAADFNSYEAAKLLIENGADVNAENEHGWTPLIEAAYSESREVAKLLLEHGADVDHKGHDGTSARGIGPMSAWLIEFQYLLKNPHGEKIRASFDCEKADSIVDRIICRDKLLATLDVQLFNKRLAEEHSPDKGLTKKEAVLQKQKIWRGSLHDKCRIQGHIFPEDKKFMEVRHCLEVIYQLKLL